MFNIGDNVYVFEKRSVLQLRKRKRKECDLIYLGNRTEISLNSLVLSDFISCILVL